MKKLTTPFGDISNYANLYKAYLSARKGKKSRKDVIVFTANLESNLCELMRELSDGSYIPGEYNEFYINEPKRRLVMALPFRDRVVQWAIYRQLNPFFERRFIHHSYACIKNRGTHRAVATVEKWARCGGHRELYYLKMDIAKYFYRVDHNTLNRILAHHIQDNDILKLLHRIIESSPVGFGLELNAVAQTRVSDKGMPIGNLTSQLFANIYLNELDYFVKRVLCIKRYARYMDDFIIIHRDRSHLQRVKLLIRRFISCELNLIDNAKTVVAPVSAGLPFLGHTITPSCTRLNRASALRMKRKLVRAFKLEAQGDPRHSEFIRSCRASYRGMLRHCNARALENRLVSRNLL